MKTKTIAEILAIDDTVVEAVECPEWDCTFHVRTVSSDKKDAFDQRFTPKNGEFDLVGYRAHMVAMCACDAEGKFLDPSPAEVQALGREKSAVVMDRIFAVCQRLTSDTPDEDLEKNLQQSAAGNGSG